MHLSFSADWRRRVLRRFLLYNKGTSPGWPTFVNLKYNSLEQLNIAVQLNSGYHWSQRDYVSDIQWEFVNSH